MSEEIENKQAQPTAEEIKQSQYVSLGKESQKSVDNLKKIINTDVSKTIVAKSKVAINGTIVGVIAGIAIAMYYGKPIIRYAICGGIIVGVGSYLVSRKSAEISKEINK